MRTLTATQLSSQKSGHINPLVKLTLTKGLSSYEFDITRVIDIDHLEEAFSQKTTIKLRNDDQYFTDIDLKGYSAVISYGLITSGGNEYSDCAPLTVITQRFESAPGVLSCHLDCIGIFNLMAEDRASETFAPTAAADTTVKTLLQNVAGAGLNCFSYCQNYQIVFDSEDSLIDTFQPRDTFRIYTNGSRLAAFRRLLDYTGCMAIVKADGKIHVFQPRTSADAIYENVPYLDTLRPTSEGDQIDISYRYPATGPHYDKVNEAIADELTTYLLSESMLFYQTDLFNIPDLTGLCTINKITVHVRAKCSQAVSDRACLKIALKTNSTVYEDTALSLTNAWANYSKEWSLNPNTGIAWTKDDINALQIGCSIRSPKVSGTENTQVTQVYVVVDYTKYELTGYDYDYEYALTTGEHVFFAKTYQTRVPVPNYVIVKSRDDDTPKYTGSAMDGSADPLDPATQHRQYLQMSLGSDNQAQTIAEALVVKARLAADGGSGLVPLNIGAEIFDLVNITDIRENSTREGNIGFIHRHWNANEIDWRKSWSMTFGFGRWASTAISAAMADMETYSDIGQVLQRLKTKQMYIESLTADNIDLTTITQDDIGDGTTYKRVLAVHLDSGHIIIDDACEYATGYDPSDKMPNDADLDDIGDGAVYKRVLSTDISAGHIKLTSDTAVNGKWYNKSGVAIDADQGITIYGSSSAFRTRATEGGADVVYIGSDGTLRIRNKDGSNGGLIIEDDAGNLGGYVYSNDGGGILVLGGGGEVELIGDVWISGSFKLPASY